MPFEGSPGVAKVIKIIPAKIDAGRIIPDSPLPEAEEIQKVSIIIEITEAATREDSSLAKLEGILEGTGASEAEYYEYLEQKHR